MNFLNDVIELEVYDENGNFVTKLDSLEKGDLYYRHNGDTSILGVTDVLFRNELLKYIGTQVESDPKNDFEKALNQDDDEQIFKFKHEVNNPKFKLIGRGLTYDPNTNWVNSDFRVIIPNAELTSGYKLQTNCKEPSKFDYVFNLLPYNDESDIFELRIKNREKVLVGYDSIGKPIYEVK